MLLVNTRSTVRILAIFLLSVFFCSSSLISSERTPSPLWQYTQADQALVLRLKSTLPGHEHQITRVEFSPDSQFLITSARLERTSKLWKTATNELIAELDGTVDLEAFRPFDRQPAAVFSADSSTVATVRDREVKLWEARTGKLKFTLLGHERNVCSIAFSSDGRRLATSGEDGMVKLWDHTTGKLISTLEVWHVKKLPRWRFVSRYVNGLIIIYLSFSPDGRKLLTTLDWVTSPAKLWDAESGRLIATLGGHIESWGIGPSSGSGLAPIHKAMFSSDGKYVATESLKETRIWDANTGSLKHTFEAYRDNARMSSDGTLIGALKKGGNIGFFDLQTAELRIPLSEPQLFATQVVFSPDSHTAAIDQAIIDISRGRISANIPFVYKQGRFILEYENYITDLDFLSFHPNGKVLMAANTEFIRLWDVENGTLITKKTEARTPVSFSPDGKLLVTTAKDKRTAQLWVVDVNTPTDCCPR